MAGQATRPAQSQTIVTLQGTQLELKLFCSTSNCSSPPPFRSLMNSRLRRCRLRLSAAVWPAILVSEEFLETRRATEPRKPAATQRPGPASHSLKAVAALVSESCRKARLPPGHAQRPTFGHYRMQSSACHKTARTGPKQHEDATGCNICTESAPVRTQAAELRAGL